MICKYHTLYCTETSDTELQINIIRLELWPPAVLSALLPPVFLQELSDEALGQLACVAEELFIEVVVHRRNVAQRFLLRVTKER